MQILLWILKNPGYVLIGLVLSLFVYLHIENGNLKKDNKDLKESVAVLVEDTKNMKINIDRINVIEGKISQTRNTQTIIRERINEVPVREEDRPFVSDPGLISRIDVMRNYQESYKPIRPSTSD